ncbi:MAG: polysaccharide biosynthesis protein [Hyphomonadaceae bacterium]|nr:polysaccharide biosynthesis protein [Hyphomonadaceae bacterium]MBX3509817.1 polysaccharide biosynthesis protein [Hyphomonadaceae bacterium]
MTVSTVLAGTAETIRAVLSGDVNWGGHVPQSVVMIGPGEAPLPVLAHAPAWDAIDFSAVQGPGVVLAASPPTVSATRAVLARAAEAGLRTMIVRDGGVHALTLNDLVGQPLRDVDWQRIRARIAGKRVLITGGGGSIGAELARRVATLGPSRLTLLDSSEYNLFKIGHELPEAVAILADVRDARSMRRWLERERPQIVFHAAALKQVPLVELFPCEGVLTNICGTRHVVDAAHAVGADVIFVSTDKAVEPSGAMGASKRLGELFCHALDRQGKQRAVPVRLGNVLSSTGSVAPLFEAQFAAGGPLTVTDPNVTRFFLSIPQAADVLLQAAALGLAEDSVRGATLVVDMGEALPVVELARDVIRLGGQRPDIDMPVTFVGLRPGEKLHERLVGGDEACVESGAAGVVAAQSTARDLVDMHELFSRLEALAQEGEADAVRRELFAALGIEESQHRAVVA